MMFVYILNIKYAGIPLKLM